MSSKTEFKRSGCPIVNSLDILGDRWTLVVLRDLYCGKEKYQDLASSPEKIPTNRLSERLKRLEDQGIVSKTLYQDKPPRYSYKLSEKGKDIVPILQAFARWGNKHIEGTWPAPDWFMKPLSTE